MLLFAHSSEAWMQSQIMHPGASCIYLYIFNLLLLLSSIVFCNMGGKFFCLTSDGRMQTCDSSLRCAYVRRYRQRSGRLFAVRSKKESTWPIVPAAIYRRVFILFSCLLHVQVQ